MVSRINPSTGGKIVSKKKLSQILEEAEVQSRFVDTTCFIPEGTLQDLITREIIEENLPRNDDPKVIQYIQNEAVKLFSITKNTGIKSRKEVYKAMKLFLEFQVTDRNLPLDKKWWATNGLDNSDDSSDSDSDQGRGIWNSARINNFLTYQPKVMAPVFNLNRDNHDLESTAILPFIKEATHLGGGSFGDVYKYGIHCTHMKKPKNPEFVCPEFIAVKKIRPGTGQERQAMVSSWEREAGVLRDMNKLEQEHIVPFLTAFRHGTSGSAEHYLIFPWARGKNLRHLWNDMPRPRLTVSMVKWAIGQIHGLSEAIYSAHEPSMASNLSGRRHSFVKNGLRGDFFRHGDLKPENILWFKEEGNDMGTLKIGDWGLAKRQNIPTQLRTARTTTPYGTCEYEPPEERTGETVNLADIKRRSRLYDIWAMGCISLEFLVWLLYGVHGLQKFAQSLKNPSFDSATFYHLELRSGKWHASIHPAVKEWMDHMAQDPACEGEETALGSLLELIKTKLLVVELPLTLGSPIRPSGRMDPNAIGDPADDDDLPAADLPPDEDGLPKITVSDAPNPSPAALQRHLEPPTSAFRKGRVRAQQFYSSMTAIADTEDRESDYWLPHAPGLPLRFNLRPEPSTSPAVEGMRAGIGINNPEQASNRGFLGVEQPNDLPTKKNVSQMRLSSRT